MEIYTTTTEAIPAVDTAATATAATTTTTDDEDDRLVIIIICPDVFIGIHADNIENSQLATGVGWCEYLSQED